MVNGYHEAGEDGTSATATERVTIRGRRSPLFWISLIVLGVLTAVLIGAWIARRPIAEHFIKQELSRRGVRATYTLESIGLHNQVIRDVTIGDPASPDLTARYAKIQMRVLWNGSVEVYRIAARGVRLRGELRNDRKVSWGEIDKLLPPPSGKPFRLPDISVDLADTSIAMTTPYGNLGFAVSGAGNLTGGFKGRLALAGPKLVTGACQLDALHGNVALGVVARRPHVTGPISADRFTCPKSRMAMLSPRLELDSGFSEAFERFDGNGRLSLASLSAGDNGLANLVANIGFEGSASDARGAIKLAAQRGRLGPVTADATRLDGDYRLWAGRGELALSADYGADSATLAPAVVARAASVVRAVSDELGATASAITVEQLIAATLQAQGHRLPRADASVLATGSYDPAFIQADADLAGIAAGLVRTRAGRLCLVGPPGSGKTAFGKWLAGEVGAPLHALRASDLMGMYVGETEKNIAQAFRKAERDGALLMIDEVGSFLQDRRGAHRSWEVSQVNEMLTQMESFAGIFIASTNLMDGLDPASLRRFDLKVRFDFLNRQQAWQLFARTCVALELAAPVPALRGRIEGLTKLTPGDFAAVSRQHRFRTIDSAVVLAAALAAECEIKEGAKSAIGFL